MKTTDMSTILNNQSNETYVKTVDTKIYITDDNENLTETLKDHLVGVASDIDNLKVAVQGVMIWVQTDKPIGIKTDDIWVDTDNYTRYDMTALISSTTLSESDNEVITASGTILIALHAATTAGIIKKIYNVGTGIVTVGGTINGTTNLLLYPGESVELITDGIGWRY